MTKDDNKSLYHEIYEKTKYRPEQAWRSSPHEAAWYIFATEGYAWLVPTDVLAQIEKGLRLVQISDTSMGFLVLQADLEGFGCERKEHNL